ncbi:MAG: nitroreductase [Hyphomicrobiales bacterium]
MDLKSYLSGRRTIPSAHLSQPGPDENQINEILTLASRTPDHGKLAPWRFVLIEGQGREQLGQICLTRSLELADKEGRVLTPAEADKAATVFNNAPIIVVLISTAQSHPKIPVWEQELAVGAVGMNLIHASNSVGFSAQWLTGWMSFDSVVTKKLGLVAKEKIAGFFHIGTPLEKPVERARPDLTTMVSRWPR